MLTRFPSLGCIVQILALIQLVMPDSLPAQNQLLPVYHFKTLEGYGREEVRTRIVRDSLGYVWIGTVNGLQRYDGYRFKVYRNNPNDPHSIPTNLIHSLLVDRNGRLWVGTLTKGLCLYDAARDRFVQVYPEQTDTSRHDQQVVFDMMEDRSGNIWLAMRHPDDLVRVELPHGSGSQHPDTLARSLHFRNFPVSGTPGSGWLTDVCERKDGIILATSLRGLITLDPSTGLVSYPHLRDPIGRRLDTLAVGMGLIQASDGTFWLGTATEGVFRIDWESEKVVNYRYGDGDSLSISSDEISDIAEDRRGNLWIGTAKGVDLFSPKTGKRIPYLTLEKPPGGSKRVRLSVDRTGTVWVGTGRDVYQLSLRSQLFPHFSYADQNGPSKSSQPRLGSFQNIQLTPGGILWGMTEGKLVCVDIATRSIMRKIDVCSNRNPFAPRTGPGSSLVDGQGNFWCAAWDLGIFRVNLATGIVKNYNYETPFGKMITVSGIVQGFDGSLWISAFEQGLLRFTPTSGMFLKTRFEFASTIIKDHEGRIWVSGFDGLTAFDPVTGTTEHFINVPTDPRSLSQTLTGPGYEDPSGRIWIASGNAINLWDPPTRSFTRYPNPAFSDWDANPIGCDTKGRLWVTYGNGALSILEPTNGRFTNFDYNDGLCGAITDIENLEDSRIILTGWAGVNIIRPDSVDPDRTPPPLVITRMTINDEPAVPPQLLKGSASLHLPHTQNVLEFEFAAMDIDGRGPAEYQYQLKGHERDWVKPTDRRYVRYTGVPPGDYEFKLRAASAWGRWPDQEIAIAVSIAPPWWRTAWAYAAYALIVFGLLFAMYRVRLHQVQLQQEVKMEHFQREHLAEVDRLKSRFFANISHEFRTPLTLILQPLEKIRSKIHDDSIAPELGMMQRNAQRLLKLINQLLDLSKLEAGAMKLRASRMNIVPFIKGIVYSFESSAGLKGITLKVDTAEEDIEVYCDREMIEKILTNLLSNAFKFTREGGCVTVRLTEVRNQTSEVRTRNSLGISVSDTGVGIPADQLDKIFNRFYQVDASQTREHEGSGLGLALVKELVELHHGTLAVQSEVGKGTTFTVQLPLGQSNLKDDEIIENPVSIEPVTREVEGVLIGTAGEEGPGATQPESFGSEKPIVLIVEDNADVRVYITGYLAPAYQVMEAKDGDEGIAKARECIPDLVISDVMMPKKDGYELCKALKLDEKTSHIPIVLLTAKAATENRIEGLEIGADDYLIKPFEPKELLARVKNLIDLRRRLRERFNIAVPLRPGEVAVTSMDDTFLQKVMAVVEQQMGNEEFSVEKLAQEMAMSRSQLHRKLTALTNQSPVEFIRYLRLHRAMDLLEKNSGTISEIAYSVGFGDPSYFSKCFRTQFGKMPIEVKHATVEPHRPA